MRSLYLRFFLSFWAATLLVLGFTVAATLWLAMERQERDFDRQDDLAREASAVLDASGVPGLRSWLGTQVQRVAPDRLYVLDQQGRDLIGRPVPGFLQAAVGRGPYPDRPAGILGRPDYRLLSQLVSTQTNETFALSLWRPPNRGLRMLGIFGSRETPLVVLLATLLVSASVCYVLARYLSAPIKHLRAATHSIADGDLAVQVAGLLGGRRDELAMLAVDFDAMAARLRALLESQQQLLRDVSHELRSPLARLQIALGLARRPGANLQQELDRIELEAQRLDELIGEILSLSRLEDPARTMRLESVPLDELLEHISEDARVEAGERGVQVALQATAGLEVAGDRELLHRAIENVVRNAVRFSPAGGSVVISAMPATGGVRISVQDQGPGVPAEYLQRIFEPFFRVGSARERDTGGNGIGLAIAARVVALHGGTISAGNLEPHGLAVSIALPHPPAVT